MRKVILRADASKTIGFGHFIRSLALGEYLKSDFDCFFCTFNSTELKPSQYQLKEIARIASYLPIEADGLDEYNEKFLNTLEGNEIVVLDNYYFTTEYQRSIKEKGCKVVYVDGMNNQQYVVDLLISPGTFTKSDFSMDSHTFFLNGISHSFLREPFLKAQKCPKHTTRIQSVVLALGGADPFNLTNKIIRLLLEVNPDILIETIAGDTVVIDHVLIDNSNVKLHRNLKAEEIVDVFSKVDLGLFSASTICIEAIACQLPIAAGWYVDNQREFYRYGVSEGLFLPLGNFLENNTELKRKISRVLSSPSLISTSNIDFNKGKTDIISLFKSL